MFVFLSWRITSTSVVNNQDLHVIILILFLFAFFPRFAGYETGACLQPEAVSLTLNTLVSPVPVVLIAVGLLILKTYPIDEKTRQENQKLLQKML